LVDLPEGIEDADTAVALRGLGCDFGQGYHFARPVPVEQMLDRLEPPDFVATVVEPDESVPVLVDVGQAGAVPGE
jgi:predicted signal transduction protein with EAL and GGDEF domain